MTTIPTSQQLAAELAFLREIMLDFYSTQIDAGAVLREEIAQHLRAAANRVADADPLQSHHVTDVAVRMINALPEGWASGDDDWQEPA